MPHTEREPSTGDAAPHSTTLRVSTRVVLLACLVCLAGLGLTLAFSSFGDEGEHRNPVDASTVRAPVDWTARDNPMLRSFEEPLPHPLARLAHEVELTLLSMIRDAGLPPERLAFLEVQPVSGPFGEFEFHSLRVEPGEPIPEFVDRFRARLAATVPQAVLADPAEPGGFYTVTIRDQKTHHLLFQGPAPATLPLITTPTPPGKPGCEPMLAIVIDDLGEDLRFASELAALEAPMGFAIWPHATYGPATVAVAKNSGNDLLLHQPMEPVSYPMHDPGESALFTTMDDASVRQVLVTNLEAVPGLIGINNHMGSRFTQHGPGMRVVLSELAARGLFFLDSRTSPGSVAAIEAKALGVPLYRRDIFLDNVAEIEAIVLQLRKAERVALRKGQAVAIGHPYPETLAALREWLATRNESAVKVVSLSSLTPQYGPKTQPQVDCPPPPAAAPNHALPGPPRP